MKTNINNASNNIKFDYRVWEFTVTMFDYILLYVTGNKEVPNDFRMSQLIVLTSILLSCLESWEVPNDFDSRTIYSFVQIKQV